jgi:hypothetical protein
MPCEAHPFYVTNYHTFRAFSFKKSETNLSVHHFVGFGFFMLTSLARNFILFLREVVVRTQFFIWPLPFGLSFLHVNPYDPYLPKRDEFFGLKQQFGDYSSPLPVTRTAMKLSHNLK